MLKKENPKELESSLSLIKRKTTIWKTDYTHYIIRCSSRHPDS